MKKLMLIVDDRRNVYDRVEMWIQPSLITEVRQSEKDQYLVRLFFCDGRTVDLPGKIKDWAEKINHHLEMNE